MSLKGNVYTSVIKFSLFLFIGKKGKREVAFEYAPHIRCLLMLLGYQLEPCEIYMIHQLARIMVGKLLLCSSQSKTKILYYMWYSKILLYMQLRNVDVCQANKHEEGLLRSAVLIFNPAVTPLGQEESYEKWVFIISISVGNL